MCLCVFTSAVGIRKSVIPFPHEMGVAFYQEDGHGDGIGSLSDTCAWGVISRHKGDVRKCPEKWDISWSCEGWMVDGRG